MFFCQITHKLHFSYTFFFIMIVYGIMTRSSLASVGPVSLDKTSFANFRYEAHLRQGGFVRNVCFGVRDITCFLDVHNHSLRESWYNLNKYSINQAIDNGDLFSAPVLEWKIMWNRETLKESLQDYVFFLQNHGSDRMTEEQPLTNKAHKPKTKSRSKTVISLHASE